MHFFAKATLTVALFSVAAGASAFDFKSLSDSASKTINDAAKVADDATGSAQATLDQANSQFAVAGDTADLVNSLSSQLGVTQTQAAGGTAALMSLAQTQLSGSQFSSITDKVSGLTGLLGSGESSGGMLGTVLGNVQSLQGVQTAFSALGLSPDMISQFAPMVLQFLGGQGVQNSLLGSLQNLWTPAA
ncbi:hypothetical protein S7S_00795 [Isoalcanivorax pacificus W11-5]|uniref:DUF2780 domain-containing protein n=1 Tax=Isoalcanivorax pacificus W11-5 TaxID=391936 RepID=A0A0B4XJ42_9GAMM|nr:DUF2780 domain-containing protein [Isoalcanivorax pacificus]AJD46583.1 hypothetical protein S7S_00795 [Isoalcanivorax pacificus W11-5]